MASSGPELEPEPKQIEEAPAVDATSGNDEKTPTNIEDDPDRTALEDDPHRAALEDNPDEPEKMTFMKGLALFVGSL
jgi:hypothetical protein